MTKLLFLEEFNVTSCNAQLLSLEKTEDERIDVILDATCFYPRGGGQDWDMGNISSADGEFAVQEVRLDENGIVHHVGTFTRGTLMPNDEVTCNVDRARRTLNTRLHSAGHVIDMAIDNLGLDWIATKGQHYPHLSAVEYSGTWNPEGAEELRIAIENRANEFTQRDTENKILFMPASEMHKVCRHVPANIPQNKPARVVMYGDDFGIPCGGTHVKNLHEVGTISVPKLKAKKGVIRVNYEISDTAQ